MAYIADFNGKKLIRLSMENACKEKREFVMHNGNHDVYAWAQCDDDFFMTLMNIMRKSESKSYA